MSLWGWVGFEQVIEDQSPAGFSWHTIAVSAVDVILVGATRRDPLTGLEVAPITIRGDQWPARMVLGTKDSILRQISLARESL